MLRMGIYQLGYMDSVPEYAAVNESVMLAKKFAKGREGFINGVLRAYVRKKEEIVLPDPSNKPMEYLSVKYSCNIWICKLWTEQFGFETAEKLLKSSQGNPYVSIRVNNNKIGRQELMENLVKDGFDVMPSSISENGIKILRGGNLVENPYYKKGFFSIQDESSMKTVDILEPKAGDLIFDICAAPGGKTLAMAEQMKNQGKIIASDIYPNKLKLIEEQSKRLGITIVETRVQDGMKPDEALYAQADKVIVDVPCSGLGVIRRKPEIKFKEETYKDFEDLPEKQLKILSNASNYVKNGGILQYSTCTVNKKENQDVVKRFLDINYKYKVVQEHQFMPHIDNTDGFYVCKMIKNA